MRGRIKRILLGTSLVTSAGGAGQRDFFGLQKKVTILRNAGGRAATREESLPAGSRAAIWPITRGRNPSSISAKAAL